MRVEGVLGWLMVIIGLWTDDTSYSVLGMCFVIHQEQKGVKDEL